MTPAPRHVLVTDAHSTSALSVVRSLGSHGMRVTAAGEQGRFNLAGYSRYVERSIVLPSAEADPAGYLDRLEGELRRTHYDLLMPTTDTTVTLIRHRRSRIEDLVRIALPCNEALTAAQDKAMTLRVAAETGVAAPRTWTFDSIEALRAGAHQVSYPCVVKPRFSCRWDGNGALVRATVRHADSPESLIRAFAAARCESEFLLVQEKVEGTGVGVFVLASEGTPLAVFAHRRLREANPTGGRASLAESIKADDRLLPPALRLLAALKWTGVAMIEFKDAGAPNPPMLMEINGRFWGSLPLAVKSGVDFPWLLARLMLGEDVPRTASYTTGVRCRHLKGDISYLIAAFKGRPRGWGGPYRRGSARSPRSLRGRADGRRTTSASPIRCPRSARRATFS